MTAESPLRYVRVTAAYGICGHLLPPGHQKWCADACRQKAYRGRKKEPRPNATPPAGFPAKDFTVYECPSCGERLLGEQRCPGCQVFARRLDFGGLCPHCDEPVTLTDLGLSSDVSVPTKTGIRPEVRAMGT